MTDLPPNPTLTEALDSVASNTDLSSSQAAAVLGEIMRGRVSAVQTAGFLTALRTKGETTDEVVGLAQTMREFAARVVVSGCDLVDTAGTGGGRSTFNVSTTAAFIAAGAGCQVAKHGNRSATGRSGSADLLEALGARIDLPSERIAECIESVGFGFMFAPLHHPATKHVVPIRKGLGVRTVFNFLGPLTNPAGAGRQLIGLSERSFQGVLAGALAKLGTTRSMVVSSEDAFDELSISGATSVMEIADGEAVEYTLCPEDVGLDVASPRAVAGGDPVHNAAITRAVLAGEPGARRDISVLNAGAAIYLCDKAPSIAGGVEIACGAIDSGEAQDRMQRFIELTQLLGAD